MSNALSIEECIQLNFYASKAVQTLRVETPNFDSLSVSEKLDTTLSSVLYAMSLKNKHEHLMRLVEIKDSSVVDHVLRFLQSSEYHNHHKADLPNSTT